MNNLSNNFNLNIFLKEREERVENQLSLLKKYNSPLLTIRANYPGDDKNRYPAKEIVNIITDKISSLFENSIIFFSKNSSLEGEISTFIIGLDLKTIKEKAIFIEENHPLGRFVDIDVYSPSGDSLSRLDFGYNRRKCYLCSNEAVLCSRETKHSLLDIHNHIVKHYQAFLRLEKLKLKLENLISDIALKSCLFELSCSPSFGLVSPVTSGSHKDMDYYTFLNSSFAIKNGLSKMAKLSFSSLSIEDIFKASRKIGINTEKEMFTATHNINTHKGMIFLLGISIIATCKALYTIFSKKLLNPGFENYFQSSDFIMNNNELLESISNNIKILSKDLTKDFDLITKKNSIGTPLSNGEKLFINLGFKGVRGEVEDGLSIVIFDSLPFLEKELVLNSDFNFSLVRTLLNLMSKCNDSTIVHRGGVSTLNQVKIDSKYALDKNLGIKELFFLEKEYISKNISPGGSADLLGVTIFFYFLKRAPWRTLFSE